MKGNLPSVILFPKILSVIHLATGIFSFLFLLVSCKNDGTTEFSNRLISASSPYLREHADNPVDWYEWGEEALAKAVQENKPILISIGYASCHWCHVMEEESFMDTTVARIMNENFVAIKIDREERPDIDQIYVTAAQLISGNAGWPLNAFALPDGKPFFAGTYFTKDQWINLLTQIANIYRDDYNSILKQADAVTRGVLEFEAIKPIAAGEDSILPETYKSLFPAWQEELDFTLGGLAGAPKFPLPAVWEFLLQDYHLTKNQRALDAVTVTLDAMANGGIYDHLGGGFARYATDSRWIVPHFEKMLYDNGQLVSLYAHAYQLTNKEEYARIVNETLDFIGNELTSTEGGFYSSLNADSEGEEGTYYVWKKEEVEKLVDPNSAAIISDYYNLSDEGNWEKGKNVLYRKSTMEELSQKYGISVSELDNTIAESNQKLLEFRNKRIAPSRDEKILTSWNALMLMGYIDAYWALGRDEYLSIAIRNAQFLRSKMLSKEGMLRRSYSNGQASIEAFLDDYALLSLACIKLYQATFDKEWLDMGRQLADYAVMHFQDAASGFFYYSPPSSQLIARKMEIADQVIPSSNAVMAEVLFKLGQLYDEKSYLEISKKMIFNIANDTTKRDPYYAYWSRLIGNYSFPFYEVAVMGDGAGETSRTLMKNYLPDILLMGGSNENLPLLENKYVSGKTIIYVCQDKVCKLPVTEVAAALDQLRTAR